MYLNEKETLYLLSFCGEDSSFVLELQQKNINWNILRPERENWKLVAK